MESPLLQLALELPAASKNSSLTVMPLVDEHCLYVVLPSGQVPNEKVFGLIAKAAWDLHKAVVGLDDVHVSRAGFQQP